MKDKAITNSASITNINWLGMATLFKREIWRFSKVWNQTVLAPVINALLFLGVLVLALGGDNRSVGDMPFNIFVAPGLVMMAILQNAFANTSSSLMLSKIQGVIIDLLMPPLKGWEITIAMTGGAIIRGSVVCLCVMIGVYAFVPFSIHSIPHALFFVIFSSMLMALLGILGGIVSNTFDQMSAFTNYIITPLAFLSGTFYSIHRLPEFWQNITNYNPFFYMIDGFRYAMTGYADSNITIGVIIIITLNISLLLLTQHLISSGWRLKS